MSRVTAVLVLLCVVGAMGVSPLRHLARQRFQEVQGTECETDLGGKCADTCGSGMTTLPVSEGCKSPKPKCCVHTGGKAKGSDDYDLFKLAVAEKSCANHLRTNPIDLIATKVPAYKAILTEVLKEFGCESTKCPKAKGKGKDAFLKKHGDDLIKLMQGAGAVFYTETGDELMNGFLRGSKILADVLEKFKWSNKECTTGEVRLWATVLGSLFSDPKDTKTIPVQGDKQVYRGVTYPDDVVKLVKGGSTVANFQSSTGSKTVGVNFIYRSTRWCAKTDRKILWVINPAAGKDVKGALIASITKFPSEEELLFAPATKVKHEKGNAEILGVPCLGSFEALTGMKPEADPTGVAEAKLDTTPYPDDTGKKREKADDEVYAKLAKTKEQKKLMSRADFTEYRKTCAKFEMRRMRVSKGDAKKKAQANAGILAFFGGGAGLKGLSIKEKAKQASAVGLPDKTVSQSKLDENAERDTPPVFATFDIIEVNLQK